MRGLLSRIQLYKDTDNAIIRDVIFIVASMAALCVYFNLNQSDIIDSEQSSEISFVSVSITQFVFSLSIILEMMGIIKNKPRGASRLLVIVQTVLAVFICSLSILVTSIENLTDYLMILNIILILNLIFIVCIATIFLFDLTISCVFLSDNSNNKPENHLL